MRVGWVLLTECIFWLQDCCVLDHPHHSWLAEAEMTTPATQTWTWQRTIHLPARLPLRLLSARSWWSPSSAGGTLAVLR